MDESTRICHLNIFYDSSKTRPEELTVWAKFFEDIEKESQHTYKSKNGVGFPATSWVRLSDKQALVYFMTGRDIYLAAFDIERKTLSSSIDFSSIKHLPSSFGEKIHKDSVQGQEHQNSDSLGMKEWMSYISKTLKYEHEQENTTHKYDNISHEILKNQGNDISHVSNKIVDKSKDIISRLPNGVKIINNGQSDGIMYLGMDKPFSDGELIVKLDLYSNSGKSYIGGIFTPMSDLEKNYDRAYRVVNAIKRVCMGEDLSHKNIKGKEIER